MTLQNNAHTVRRTDLMAVASLAALALGLAFGAAAWTRDWSIFSLSPPGSDIGDVTPAQREDLHRTFFTIWASLVLAAPALAVLPMAAHAG